MMSPDAKRDLQAWNIATLSCHQQHPGETHIRQPNQLLRLGRPAFLGGMARLFTCLRANVGAVKFATEGAAVQDPLSEWILGTIYHDGLPGAGIAANPTKGFAYFMQSARQGFPLGLLYAGGALIQGSGTAPNPKMGAALILRLAMHGVPLAMRIMGGLYLHGTGVPPDPQRALYWLKRAAAAGDPVSRQWLAAHQHAPVETGARSTPTSPEPHPGTQAQSAAASAPAVHAPVDHQQELEQLQRFWTLYFNASHAQVVDFGTPALVRPVGFGGAP
jgi:TPR repeat protein